MRNFFIFWFLLLPSLSFGQAGKLFYFHPGPHGGVLLGEHIETSAEHSPWLEELNNRFEEDSYNICFSRADLQNILQKIDSPVSKHGKLRGKLATLGHVYYFYHTYPLNSEDEFAYDENFNHYKIMIPRDKMNRFFWDAEKRCAKDTQSLQDMINHGKDPYSDQYDFKGED